MAIKKSNGIATAMNNGTGTGMSMGGNGSGSSGSSGVNTNGPIDTAIVTVENSGSISLEKVEETRQTYDLVNIREQYKNEILASGEIDRITSQVDLGNIQSIVEFGKEPAAEMAKVADQVLSKYNMNSVQETTILVESLVKVMKQVDIEEIKGTKYLEEGVKKKSFFDRFRESAEEKLNRLVGKYQTIGADMEKICTQLAIYEQQIKDTNKDIEVMYEQAKINYKNLTKYILAGEQAIKEIQEYRDEKQEELRTNGDPNIQFDIQGLNQVLTLMEQRVADLRCAEAIALQSVPTFKIQEYTNANLSRKIQSAFIVTVPAFKSALVNSVIAKQQSIQTQGLMALDEATSMLLRQNADNAVAQLQSSQKIANSSSVSADDIEYVWNTLMNGIKQYREEEEKYREIRKQEAVRIEQANEAYLQSLSQGSAI